MVKKTHCIGIIMSKIMRISEESYYKLDKIKKSTGFSMQQVLDKAIAHFDREFLLKKASDAYSIERNSSKEEHEKENEEHALWDNALMDGLEDE